MSSVQLRIRILHNQSELFYIQPKSDLTAPPPPPVAGKSNSSSQSRKDATIAGLDCVTCSHKLNVPCSNVINGYVVCTPDVLMLPILTAKQLGTNE